MSEGPDGGPRRSSDPSNTGEQAADGDHATGTDPFASLPETDGADPFERLGVDSDLGERTPAAEAELFEAVALEPDVADASWEELVSDDGVFDDVTAMTGEETVVPKRRYCQDCGHFTDPPDVACTHPVGEILEVTDVEHFRVRDCPVVAYRREHSAYQGSEHEADD